MDACNVDFTAVLLASNKSLLALPGQSELPPHVPTVAVDCVAASGGRNPWQDRKKRRLL